MKDYPSISRDFSEFDAYIFDKPDGSNLRFEWSRKRKQWYKCGTRTQLFDHTHDVFGGAIQLFQDTLAESLGSMAFDERWESVVVFAEFVGPSSFAGWHKPDEPKTLQLFDIAPHKKGILGPSEYLKLVEKYEVPSIAAYLGPARWTRGFVDQVWRGEVPGVTFEGVVGKGGSGHKLILRKAKTKAWIDAVHGRYDAATAAKIIES